MTIQEYFLRCSREMKLMGISDPQLEVSWIFEKYLGLNTVERIQNSEKEINALVLNQIQQAILRRIKGEPLAYILQEKDFYGRRFFVNQQVLIPRPETEGLVEWGLSWLKKQEKKEVFEILDLGTGSGCIGLSIVKERADTRLTAVDTSSAALLVAQINANNLEVADRVQLLNIDTRAIGEQNKKFDLILANPPYIDPSDTNIESNVKKHEPSQALFAADQGLAEIISWLKAIKPILKTNSAVGFEIGSTQGEKVLELFSDLDVFSTQYILKDYSGLDRIVCGER